VVVELRGIGLVGYQQRSPSGGQHESGWKWNHPGDERFCRCCSGCRGDGGRCSGKFEQRRLWIFASIRSKRNYCRQHGFNRHSLLLLELRHLYRHLGPRQLCSVSIAHIRQWYCHQEWYFHGMPSCLRRRSTSAGIRWKQEQRSCPGRLDRRLRKGCHLGLAGRRHQCNAVRG